MTERSDEATASMGTPTGLYPTPQERGMYGPALRPRGRTAGSSDPARRFVAALLIAAQASGCALGDFLGRVVDDPSRICPPGHVLTSEGCVVRPPAPTPTPCPGQPGGVPCPEGQETQYESTHGSRLCWCGTPVPPYVTPTATPTSTPTSTPTVPPTVAPTSTPTPEPTAAPIDLTVCLRRDEVPAGPVPVFTGRPCRIRDGFLPVWDPGTATDGCIRNWRCADGNQEFQPIVKIGDSLRWGGPNGVHRCNDGEAPGPGYICDAGRPPQEAYGRNMDGNGNILVPDGVDRDTPWSRAGICKPVWCEAPPPVPPVPTAGPTPSGPPPTGCDVVERVNHWMAPGNKAHGWNPQGDLIRGVIDSTIRSDAGICDLDHVEDWERCGRRHHDADFRKRRYAFHWIFSGIVEDQGPNTDDDDNTCSTRDGKFPLISPECSSSWENSAQRVILAERGACVKVTVCIPDGARTPDGCRITAQGGGCGTRKFLFPEGGDCE